jgi:hypothetical protein
MTRLYACDQEHHHVILVSPVAPKNWRAVRWLPPLCGQMANLHALSDRGSIPPSLVGALPDTAVFPRAPACNLDIHGLNHRDLNIRIQCGQLADLWPRPRAVLWSGRLASGGRRDRDALTCVGRLAAEAAAGEGRLAQRESASFTPRRSLVRSQYRPLRPGNLGSKSRIHVTSQQKRRECPPVIHGTRVQPFTTVLRQAFTRPGRQPGDLSSYARLWLTGQMAWPDHPGGLDRLPPGTLALCWRS